jgi:hypothetical protein
LRQSVRDSGSRATPFGLPCASGQAVRFAGGLHGLSWSNAKECALDIAARRAMSLRACANLPEPTEVGDVLWIAWALIEDKSID